MDTQPVQGATNGENDESVLLNNEEGGAGGSITKRIEDKVRAGLKVEHFVRALFPSDLMPIRPEVQAKRRTRG
jgi:hypothetical protein